ncbi:hypothetical protein K2Z84_07305 [Candidatus Binatia bacterium]|jgi:hypothetical protein|nr:hypothetical protein [Candidatus Binatia bacterium]
MRSWAAAMAFLLIWQGGALAQTCGGEPDDCRLRLHQLEEQLALCATERTDLAAQVVQLQGFHDAYLAETWDSDLDGLPDRRDVCLGTREDRSIDVNGCSLDQFCGRVPVASTRDRRTCRTVDWNNDEPRKRHPHDCRVDEERCVAAVAEPRTTGCTSVVLTVATGFAGQAAGVTTWLSYPADRFAIPGFGVAALARISNLTGIAGLFNGADVDLTGDGSEDAVSASLISLAQPIVAGPFVSIVFDCVAPGEEPMTSDFGCTSDVADIAGRTLPSTCTVEISAS